MILLHGLGGAQDLPVPAPLAIAAGGVALVASFVVLVLAWRTPRYDDRDDDRDDGRRAGLVAFLDSPGWRGSCRVVGLVFFGYVAWALIAGPDNNNNPVLGVFYVLVWVGVVLLSQ